MPKKIKIRKADKAQRGGPRGGGRRGNTPRPDNGRTRPNMEAFRQWLSEQYGINENDYGTLSSEQINGYYGTFKESRDNTQFTGPSILDNFMDGFTYNNVLDGFNNNYQGDNAVTNALQGFKTDNPQFDNIEGFGSLFNNSGSGLSAINLGFQAMNDASTKSADKASNDLIDQTLNSNQFTSNLNLFDNRLGFEKGGAIPTNPNGLYEESGPVLIPSRQLTFEGIDTPTIVVPVPGEDRVLEIPLTKEMMKKFNMKDGGYIGNFIDGTPIQTELINGLAEQIIFSDGSIAEVNATDSHKKMKKDGDEDVVTDVLPPDSYITSAYGGIKIRKMRADEIETGIKQTGYSELKKGEIPEVFTLADYFLKREKALPAAELTLRVKKKYEVVGREDDAFAALTDEANRRNRMPDLQGIITISEEEKAKKENAKKLREMNKLIKEIGGGIKIYQKGGKVHREGTPKAFLGALTAIVGIGKTLYDVFSNESKNGKIRGAAENLSDRNKELIAKLQELNESTNGEVKRLILEGRDENSNGITGSAAAQVASLLAQDPNIDFTDRTTQGIDESIAATHNLRNTAPEQIFNQSTRQINTAALLEAGVDPSQIQSIYNSAIQQGSDASLSANINTLGQENALRGQRDNILNLNIAGNDAETNGERSNRNALLNQFGNVGAQFFSAQGQNSLLKNQELANQSNRFFGYQSNILNLDFQNETAAQSLALGTTNPLAGVDIAGIGDNLNSIFNFGGSGSTAATGSVSASGAGVGLCLCGIDPATGRCRC